MSGGACDYVIDAGPAASKSRGGIYHPPWDDKFMSGRRNRRAIQLGNALIIKSSTKKTLGQKKLNL